MDKTPQASLRNDEAISVPHKKTALHGGFFIINEGNGALYIEV